MQSKEITIDNNSIGWNDHSEEDRMIAVAAYYIAEKHGFTPNHELADWLEAELEIEGYLNSFQA